MVIVILLQPTKVIHEETDNLLLSGGCYKDITIIIKASLMINKDYQLTRQFLEELTCVTSQPINFSCQNLSCDGAFFLFGILRVWVVDLHGVPLDVEIWKETVHEQFHCEFF